MRSTDGQREPRGSRHEAIEATAAAWLAQRDDDGLSPLEEKEFLRWQDADPRHRAAVARLEATWMNLQRLRNFRPDAQRHPNPDLLRAATPSHRKRRIVPFPAFAGLTVAASILFAAVWWYAAADAAQEYKTTADGYQRVALADGSLLDLNANSELIVRFTAAERRVRLVRGEAHFNVAKNRTRPFLVEVGGVAVRAVGTAFNVRLDDGDLEVLVTEGKVQVEREMKPMADAAASKLPNTPARTADELPRRAPATPVSITPVVANERAFVPRVHSRVAIPAPRPVIEKVTPAVVRESLAWQGPRLVFVDTPLADAIAQFNRRNPVQIELADPELGELPIGGSFRAENVEAFVRLLSSGGGIDVERPDLTRIILRKRENL